MLSKMHITSIKTIDPFRTQDVEISIRGLQLSETKRLGKDKTI